MHNFVLSPIDPEKLIANISEKVSASILKALQNHTTNQQTEQLFTVQEAAKFLNLKVPTIYSKVNKGELPVMKRGKRLYFSSVELMDYLKEGRRQSNTEVEDIACEYFRKKGGYDA